MNAEVLVVLLAAVGCAALLSLGWFLVLYNGLVRARNACDEAWADVDTELKRRHDLIPNLVEVVRGYAQHERETLVAVIAARDRASAGHGSVGDQARDEVRLVREVRGLLAVSERYPALRADDRYRALMEELVDTEDRIQAARRFYNGNVRDLANRIETIPSNLVAGACGFARREFFEVEDAVRVAPGVGA